MSREMLNRFNTYQQKMDRLRRTDRLPWLEGESQQAGFELLAGMIQEAKASGRLKPDEISNLEAALTAGSLDNLSHEAYLQLRGEDGRGIDAIRQKLAAGASRDVGQIYKDAKAAANKWLTKKLLEDEEAGRITDKELVRDLHRAGAIPRQLLDDNGDPLPQAHSELWLGEIDDGYEVGSLVVEDREQDERIAREQEKEARAAAGLRGEMEVISEDEAAAWRAARGQPNREERDQADRDARAAKAVKEVREEQAKSAEAASDPGPVDI